MFDKMFDEFDEFLFEHDWARRWFIIALIFIAGIVDIWTFVITFTQWDTNPMAIFVIWVHRLLLMHYNKKNDYSIDILMKELRFYW